MIHHLLFADTFFVDLLMPFYLLIDSLLNIGFYKPYLNLTNHLNGLVTLAYGYIFSAYFFYKIFSSIDWKFSKKATIDNLVTILLYVAMVEVFLIYFCGAIALSDLLVLFFNAKNPLATFSLILLSFVMLAPIISAVGIIGFHFFKKFSKWRNI
jgi:hypothetical protein